jgi:hypothetical protein
MMKKEMAAIITIITGVCIVCGKFQKDKKFKRQDKHDNAAINFVVCNICKKEKKREASRCLLFEIPALSSLYQGHATF